MSVAGGARAPLKTALSPNTLEPAGSFWASIWRQALGFSGTHSPVLRGRLSHEVTAPRFLQQLQNSKALTAGLSDSYIA